MRQHYAILLASLRAAALAVLLALPAAAAIPDQLPDPDGKPADRTKPVKVFVLMGQSNMVGMGDISGGSSRWGSEFLAPVVSVYAGKYSPDADDDSLIPIKTMELPAFGGVKPTPYPGGGTQVVRGHIQMAATGVYRFKPGYQASTHNVMEVDGKELHRKEVGGDILPPGSERFTYDGRVYAGYKDSPASWPEGTQPEPINWYAGKQYDEFVKATHEVLDNSGSLFPAYKDQGYQIAGFVWWQGHKDGNPAHASRYEQNLVRLIKTLRKEFDAPEAPFVLGTIGFGGWELQGDHLTVANAQLAVSGENGKYPELKGNVLTVETRDFWRPVERSPRDQGYHYNRNAETYMLVGDALGRGMVTLLAPSKK